MARDVLGTEAAEGVLLVFDSPEVNQPHDEGGVALMMERLAKMVVSGAPLVPLDVSRYYGIDFAATSAYVEADEPEPARLERPSNVPVRR